MGISGSEIAIMNLMDSLSNEIHFITYIANPGNRSELDFQKRRQLLKKPYETIFQKSFRYVTGNKKFGHSIHIQNYLKKSPQDYLLLNTILAVNYVNEELLREQKIILYVHETELMLVNLSKEKLLLILKEVNWIFCSSNYIKDYFSILGRKDRIEVLYPAVNFKNFCLPLQSPDIREKLGFKKEHFIWGMTGALLPNKNPEGFIKAALKITKKFPNTRFLWMGSTGNSGYELYLRRYIREKSLEGLMFILERKNENYFQYLNCIDGYLLTSYSESFSLAALEAVAFNKPVVSFPCGGVLESVPENFRKMTSQFSIDELTELMIMQMNEPWKAIEILEVERILQTHQDIIGKRFLNILFA